MPIVGEAVGSGSGRVSVQSPAVERVGLAAGDESDDAASGSGQTLASTSRPAYAAAFSEADVVGGRAIVAVLERQGDLTRVQIAPQRLRDV